MASAFDRLLDFSQPFDVALLDQVMDILIFYFDFRNLNAVRQRNILLVSVGGRSGVVHSSD